MTFNCFIFDFDGTLAHSERAYNEAFQHSIRLHMGLEVALEEMRGYWNLLPSEVLRRYSEDLLAEMLASFEDHYYANHHHHLIAYEGIPELLDHLGSRNAHLAVVSLKPRRAGERELDLMGLGPRFHLRVWGDDVERPKPEPDGVLRVLDDLKADAQCALVIGDSPSDIMMGRAAGVRTAAALWGGADRDRLLAEKPDFCLDSPADLVTVMRDE